MNDHHRNNAESHFENGGGLLKSSSANSPFGHFDVGELDGYDSSEKIGHRLKEGNFNENGLRSKVPRLDQIITLYRFHAFFVTF